MNSRSRVIVAALAMAVGAVASAALVHRADVARMRRTDRDSEVFRSGVRAERDAWERFHLDRRVPGRRFPDLGTVRATYIRLHTEEPKPAELEQHWPTGHSPFSAWPPELAEELERHWPTGHWKRGD